MITRTRYLLAGFLVGLVAALYYLAARLPVGAPVVEDYHE